jgi:hypothetical protein
VFLLLPLDMLVLHGVLTAPCPPQLHGLSERGQNPQVSWGQTLHTCNNFVRLTFATLCCTEGLKWALHSGKV